jgi:uncharacterized delta-60 repeat protein
LTGAVRAARYGLALALSLSAASAWAQGLLDAAFGTGGKVFTTFTATPTTDRANGLAVQADGKFVVAGEGGAGFEVARYNPDGSLDGSFGTAGKTTYTFPADPGYPMNTGPSRAFTVQVQADQKIVVGGCWGDVWAAVRYHANGTLDTSFGNGGRYLNKVSTGGSAIIDLGQQSSGKLVLIGTGNALNYQQIELRRLLPDGTNDASFTPPASHSIFTNRGGQQQLADGFVDAADRIVVAGAAYDTSPSLTTPGGCLTRLLPNGGFDPSFGYQGVVYMAPQNGQSVYFHGVKQLPSGELLVVGRMGARGLLARFTASGAIDYSFGTQSVQLFDGFSNTLSSSGLLLGLALQPDGKIVVRGSSGNDFALARFQPNGTPDATFGVDGLLRVHEDDVDALTDLYVQPDGKYLGVGYAGEDAVSPQNQRFTLLRVLPTFNCMTVNAGKDRTVNATSSVNLGSVAQAGLTYNWSVSPAISGFSSTSSQTTVQLPSVSTPTVYTFTLTATDEVNVTVQPYTNPAPSWGWAQRAGGTGAMGQYSISDAAGNLYVTGTFGGTMTLGGTTLTSQGWGKDVFVAKYNSAGTLQWAQRYGGNDSEEARGMALDAQGNLYLTGAYEGTSVWGATTLTLPGFSNMFVTKLDAQGAVQWARAPQTRGYQGYGEDIKTDAQGNVFVTGWYQETFTWGNQSVTPHYETRSILMKLDGAGNAQWLRSIATRGFGIQLATDAQGNVYQAGRYEGTPTIANTTLPANQTVFLAKYNAQGTELWGVGMGGNTAIRPYVDAPLAVEADATGVYVLLKGPSNPFAIGSTSVSSTSGSYLAKLNPNGGVLWASALSPNTAYAYFTPSRLRLLADGLYVGGSFGRSSSLGNSSMTISPTTGEAVFVGKFDPATGTNAWAQYSEEGRALLTGLSGTDQDNLYLTGTLGLLYQSVPTTVRFGTTSLTTGNGNDVFVAKLGAAPAPFTWTGAASSDWTNAANWSGNQVPGASDAATIPAGLTTYPQLSGSQTVGSLSLLPGAALTQTAGTLTVNNALVNAGTFTQTGGTLALAGATPQTLGGSALLRLRELQVGPAGATLGGPVQVSRLLTLQGNLATNGQPLTLLSDATGSALVVNNGGAVQGNATVQRYLDGGFNAAAGYRHLAAPVSGSTVADLSTASYSPTVNPAYNTGTGSVSPFPTVFGYDETRLSGAASFDAGWVSPGATTDALVPGRGYTVNLAPQTVDFVGTLGNGALTMPLTRGAADNAGWHLLGNPYPAPIDWNLLTRSGVDNALYVYRSTGTYAGGYRSYVNGVGGVDANLIGQGQGFFVRAAAAGASLGFSNAARLTTPQNVAVFRTQETRPLVVLDLRLQGGSAAQADELYVYQQAGATLGFDAQYDALKVQLNGGQQPSIYQQTATHALSIQGVADGTQPVALPLGMNAPTAGSYQLTASQVLNFPAGQPLYLEDRQTNTWHDLSQGAYTAQLPQGLTATRFVLHLYAARPLAAAAPALNAVLAVYPNPVAPGRQVTVEAAQLPAGKLTLRLLNSLGQVVRTEQLTTAGSLRHALHLDGQAAGVYSLQLVTATGTATRRLVVR